MSSFSRINTNIQAQRAFQNLSNTSDELQDRQERLTTGLRINSASDDAAGFEIASQLEAKTGAQQQALRNIGDAKSTLSTAEGALDSQLDILQSAQEKATQAANGSLSQNERKAIGTELSALVGEVDDIADNTTFNGDQLIKTSDGSDVGLTFQTGAESDTTFDVNIASSTAGEIGIQSDTGLDPSSTSGGLSTNSGDFASGKVSASSSSIASGVSSGSFDGDLEGGTFEVSVTNGEDNGSTATIKTQADEITADLSSIASGDNIDLEKDGNGNSLTLSLADTVSFTDSDIEQGETKSFQVQAVTEKNIGTRIAKGGGEEARNVINDVQSAIDGLTSELSDLGASQNRLSFKESNLETTRTNLNAAQSRIEDADLAKEQTQVAKLQVQQQSGTAQLAQANAAGQSVLSLLQ